MNNGKRVSWQISAVSAAALVAGVAQAHDRYGYDRADAWRDYGHHERYDRYYSARPWYDDRQDARRYGRPEHWRDYRWRHHHGARYYGPAYDYGYRVWSPPLPPVILPPLPPWHR